MKNGKKKVPTNPLFMGKTHMFLNCVLNFLTYENL